MVFVESLASALTSSALKPPFEKLLSYTWSKIKLTQNPGEKLRRLERTLLKIQSLIDQLEGEHSTSDACRLLIEDFKGVLLDSDDFLAEIHHQLPENDPSSLCIGARGSVGKWLEVVDNLFTELEAYFISEVTKPRPSQISHDSTSFVDPSSVIGLKKENEGIKLLLAADDKNTTVISIVGMAGIGKTTLAQLVFNDPEVVGSFNERMWWVCVSWEYDLIQITKSILEAATSRVCTLSNLNFIMSQLKKVMGEGEGKGKGKFLLVLDDMCNESPSDWGALKLLFSFAAPGSRVLVTTRSTTVSSIVTTNGDLGRFSLTTTTLSKHDCWEIVKKNLKTEVDNREDLKAIGLELAEKCKGLPLAAKVIGDALHFKLEEVEWEALLKCHPWDLPEDKNQVYRTLKPSYVHLPAYLTRCFVYFSIIPQSQKVKVQDLIQIWAAEGFIGAQGVRRIEDIGMEYLKELCSRSFIEILSGEIKMNDFIHDLATSVSTNLCLRLEDTMFAKYTSFLSQKNVRYLSLLCQSPESDVCTAKLKELYRYQKLRTLMFFFHVNQLPTNLSMSVIFQKFFEMFKWLRVLKLTGSLIRELSGPIDKLERLHYLDLSNTKIAKLPKEIVNLLALETLQLENCTELKEWPKKFEKLVKLRHLHFDRHSQMSSMPKNFGKLTSLENLATVAVEREEGYGIEELQNMNCLRGSIEIKNLENVLNPKNAEDAMLGKKQYLHKVKLQWDETRAKEHKTDMFYQEVMRGLEPHYSLKELEVKGYCGSTLSKWLDNPPSAKEPTRQIEKLVLSSCPQLRKLSSIRHLTSLETLEILDCPKLRSLPERELPSSLLTLSISESGISRQQCEDGGSMRETVESIPSLEIDGDTIPTAPFRWPYYKD